MDQARFTESIKIKKISESAKEGVFEVEGLFKGYGVMIGNALRRVLLSSLPGASITQIKIKGVSHEFTTLPDVLEDVVEIVLNIKRIRLRIHTDEPQVLTLRVKGEKKVTAADIETNSNVDVVTPEAHIATLTAKKAELDMELTVDKGFGYVPVDQRKMEKLAIGVIALDGIFSPIMKVNFSVENMRVGERADYNKVILSLETDGSIMPSEALQKSAKILQDHFAKVAEVEVAKIEPAVKPEEAPKKERKPRVKKVKTEEQ